MPSRNVDEPSPRAIGLAAAVGGIAPSLAVLGVRLLTGEPQMPSLTRALGYLGGLLIMAGLGASVAVIWKEKDLRKAFYMGLGLPAFLQLNIANLDSLQKAKQSFEKVTAAARPAKPPPSGAAGVFLLERPAFGDPLPDSGPGAPAEAGPRSSPQDSARMLFVERRGGSRGGSGGSIAFFGTGGEVVGTVPLGDSIVPIPRAAAALAVRIGDSSAGPYGFPQPSDGDLRLSVSVAESSFSGLRQALGAWGGSWRIDATLAAIQPRIFLHVARGDVSFDAALPLLRSELAAAGFTVMPVERVAAVPSRTELRYYHPFDRGDAEAARRALAPAGLVPEIADHAGTPEAAAVRPHTIELWLAPPPLPPPAPPAAAKRSGASKAKKTSVQHEP